MWRSLIMAYKFLLLFDKQLNVSYIFSLIGNIGLYTLV